MNPLNEECRLIREQIEFKRQLISILKGEERRAELAEEINKLEHELSVRLEQLI